MKLRTVLVVVLILALLVSVVMVAGCGKKAAKSTNPKIDPGANPMGGGKAAPSGGQAAPAKSQPAPGG